MKALKSNFAKNVLANPENRAVLCRAMHTCGMGTENGVVITVVPLNHDGTKAAAMRINVHTVPKAG